MQFIAVPKLGTCFGTSTQLCFTVTLWSVMYSIFSSSLEWAICARVLYSACVCNTMYMCTGIVFWIVILLFTTYRMCTYVYMYTYVVIVLVSVFNISKLQIKCTHTVLHVCVNAAVQCACTIYMCICTHYICIVWMLLAWNNFGNLTVWLVCQWYFK